MEWPYLDILLGKQKPEHQLYKLDEWNSFQQSQVLLVVF